ncbi:MULTISPECIES: nickel ABC transporter substrate-binding protein [Dethiosulfovibrio]|uniref:Nickel ABC transporter substrate-binding protein n=2 Tax=Dethiosulfovibrio TaxID=47054 RepID=A0ABS9EQQ0_9BACT|nr:MULTISPECIES: nickel ABC transporter substrate-binding protein [Dethiosulfovibrio]MCF4114525.1 nickel ABC transporter substrate-binding protein [Dethiosulfovibrio russensis]MCF4143509.1 nickel ABC transporter substrate-binding protein [Dethiosulfovibrio marinus]MCF4145925.1 nickel ABC transporter substrate-binding protein [Dethiosulfovibrio acidaminovorans]
MRRSRLLISLAVALSAIVLSTAVWAQESSKKTRVVYSWPSYAGPLLPHMYSPSQMYAQRMVYDPLVEYEEDGSYSPALATSWDISPDGKVYTFRLREGVEFSDGTPFDAEAVVMNFDAIKANEKRHKWMDLVTQIDGWESVDEHTFRLTLKNAYYPALAELSLIRPFRFLSPSAFPDDGDTSKSIKAPIGTGPWMLVESKKGEYDLFKANPHSWRGKQDVDEIMVKVISDPTARALAFETGEIDLIYGASTGQIDMETFNRYRSMDGIVTGLSGPLEGRNIAMNSGRFPTDDPSVRQAILHGVDRKAIVKHVFLGMEYPAETLFAKNRPYCDLNLKPYVYDPKLSAKILDKAGWEKNDDSPFRKKDGAPLTLDFCFIGTNALQKASAEAIQGDLRKIGIDVRLVAEEADSYYKRQKSGEFGMIFSSTWGAPYDPQSYCSSMRIPSHADYQAQSGLKMKEKLDRSISEVLITVDEKERADLYRYILTTLHEEAIYMPLSFSTAIKVYRECNLSDIPFRPTPYDIPFERISLPKNGI